MILLCEHPAAAAAGVVGKGGNIFPFSTFPPPTRDARAPNQSSGLARADQGHPRAALDANDLRIRLLRAQHPVESYGQLARRRHFGHSPGLAVAAVQILVAKLWIAGGWRRGRTVRIDFQRREPSRVPHPFVFARVRKLTFHARLHLSLSVITKLRPEAAPLPQKILSLSPRFTPKWSSA